MTTIDLGLGRDPQRVSETVQQHAARLTAEAALLDVARADIEQGRCLDDEAADAWLDAWERGDDVPLPDQWAIRVKP